MSDIFDLYPDFRDKPAEMAMMCAVLRNCGRFDDALALGLAAVAAAPGSAEVRTAVTATLGTGVPRFHVPMLLDHARNRAYARAIERAARPGMTVLEIGTGAGLLALLAARAGARVYTCESHPVIAAAAARIIERNGLSDRITLIRKRSTDIVVPDDLPEPADLVIHEIFGSTLFDEGVTAAMTDARRRLLKPEARSVPPRAHVRCVPVELAKPQALPPLDDVEGFDLSGFELLSTPAVAIGRHGPLPRAITDTICALSMDYDRQPPFGPSSQTVTMPSHGGRIDGIVQWIALDLGDGELHQNDPFGDGLRSSWGPALTALTTPIETRPGEPIDVTLRHRGTLLTIDVAARATG